MSEDGIPCLWMRGGTSKAAVFLAQDLPADPAARDDLLLRIMGSPDPRQIDGIGGADPLTSKVAILSPSSRDDADVDYLFLQVFVDRPLVSDAQGCGNILAAVGPAAIERGLVAVAAHRAAPEGRSDLRSFWAFKDRDFGRPAPLPCGRRPKTVPRPWTSCRTTPSPPPARPR